MSAESKQKGKKLWLKQSMKALADSGPTGKASAKQIEERGTRLGFTQQKGTGAAWFDWRKLRYGLFVNADYEDRPSDDPQLYSLIAHEAKHLEQGLLEALSVRGELVAWQLQYDILVESGLDPGDLWKQLRALDPASRADLEQARALMQESAGPGYRINLLPLWPFPAEVFYRLKALVGRPKP
jgi:hypothetical protein